MSMVDRVTRRLDPKCFEVFEANPIGSLERGLAMVQIAAAKTDARAALEAISLNHDWAMNAVLRISRELVLDIPDEHLQEAVRIICEQLEQ